MGCQCPPAMLWLCGVVLRWLSDGTSSAVPWHLLRDVQGVKGWPQQKCKVYQLALGWCGELSMKSDHEIPNQGSMGILC